MTNEEALEILTKERVKRRNASDGYPTRYAEALGMAIKALEQTRWIPVSERMPEDEQRCLIAYKGLGKFQIEIATYSTNLCKVNKYDFYNKKDISGFYGFDEEWGYFAWADVVAWMPLPEPYREEDDNEAD